MRPIYFRIDNNLPLVAVPDVDIKHDGHPIITYTYSIYKDQGQDVHRDFGFPNLHAKEKDKDARYMGTITFEQPGRLFTYKAGSNGELTGDEVRTVIEQITHYREHPNLWPTE